jgi:uncharacterized protein YqeY
VITDTIHQKIGEAMKAHDTIRLSTLQLLASALNYERIAKMHQLSEDEELVVVRREVKKRQDAIDAYEKARAQDRADKEKAEQTILKEYLPPDMPDEELTKIVDEAIKNSGVSDIRDMGKVIGIVMGQVKGKADGKKVADLVKSKLLG